MHTHRLVLTAVSEWWCSVIITVFRCYLLLRLQSFATLIKTRISCRVCSRGLERVSRIVSSKCCGQVEKCGSHQICIVIAALCDQPFLLTHTRFPNPNSSPYSYTGFIYMNPLVNHCSMPSINVSENCTSIFIDQKTTKNHCKSSYLQLKMTTIMISETIKFTVKFKGGLFPYFSSVFKICTPNVFEWPPFSNSLWRPTLKFNLVTPVYFGVLGFS